MKKYSFEDKLSIWEKVLDKNYPLLKSRSTITMQSTGLIAFLFGFVFCIILYSFTKGGATPTNIVFAVLLGMCNFWAIYFFVVNALLLVITRKINNGNSAKSQKKLISTWLKMGFIRWPNKYIIPTDDAKNFKSDAQQK
ncbi:hypothetical protein MCFN_00185 [Mycoplasmopsis californica]|uniref:Uncharacterized protein n=1 Tax=Mycoplasmopsis californica TaxID=2113 RepID=A0A059XV66_9BACT|nr:hypothetical protein [Mycoplasmopsis californica]AIA29216.1 hypothetical protein MCFN_00185 [Mycoplasmopsis californica]